MDDYDLSDALRQNYAQALNQLRSPYMKYSIGFDLSGSLAGITCPVMALNGTKDSQVQCERNLDVLKSFPR